MLDPVPASIPKNTMGFSKTESYNLTNPIKTVLVTTFSVSASALLEPSLGVVYVKVNKPEILKIDFKLTCVLHWSGLKIMYNSKSNNFMTC